MVLGWSDRSSFIPIDFALQGSKNKVSKDLPSPEMDKRTLAWHRRQEASKDKITLTKEMLIRAKNRGVDAGAVLFDSWYCYPKFVSEIFNKIGYDVISMVKTTPNLSVLVNGKTISTRRLWEQLVPTLNTETKKLNKETITTSSIICKFGDVAVKLVFCQPTDKNGKLKKKVILLSTNTELSSSEIVDIYGQRWAIEVLFKDAKSKLFFGKYQSRTFEATICFLTLSLVRFVILGYMERMNGDFRHKGSLYEDMRYEIEELNILAFMDKFLNRLLSLVDGAKEIFTLFTDKLSSIQEMVRLSIENLLFQRCET